MVNVKMYVRILKVPGLGDVDNIAAVFFFSFLLSFLFFLFIVGWCYLVEILGMGYLGLGMYHYYFQIIV